MPQFKVCLYRCAYGQKVVASNSFCKAQLWPDNWKGNDTVVGEIKSDLKGNGWRFFFFFFNFKFILKNSWSAMLC